MGLVRADLMGGLYGVRGLDPERAVVVIDIDGVLYRYVDCLAEVAHVHLGKSYDELVSAEVWDFFKAWGLSVEEYLALAEVGVRDHGFIRRGEPYENSVEGWQKLRDMGLRIHVASHCVDSASEEARKAWLKEHGFVYEAIALAPTRLQRRGRTWKRG